MSYALLDDCDASTAQPTSRLYTEWVRELVSFGAQDVDEVCAQAMQAIGHGLHAVVLADYEWGALVSDDRIDPDVVAKAQAGQPALRFLLYARCQRMSRDEVDRWLAQTEHRDAPACDPVSDRQPGTAGLAHVVNDTSRERFDTAIAAIHAALEAGDAYQINYTYRIGFATFGSPIALYRRLRARQPVRYGALIALPDGRSVLSCSPELFLRHEAGTLHAQPMKGTAARVADPALDAQVRQALASDPKNRAENLMIVDLLRNDIGRVATTGSVSVPALFSVDPYGSVWQMTSTVQAELRDDLSFAQVLRALFPCGSITGAPKHRAMELIASLETSPRGLYTGSIGWIDAAAEGRRCGEFCLSVAIRTLVLERAGRDDRQVGQMGVGAGIVLDSVAAAEWEECMIKSAFATKLDPGLGLFETMRATRTGGVAYLDRHLARLVHSAAALGLPVEASAVLGQINAYLPQLSDGVHRVKVSLDRSGHIEIGGGPLTPVEPSTGMTDAAPALREISPFSEVAYSDVTVDVLLADEWDFAPVDASNVLLQHKTTAREDYDRAWRAAETHGAFDMLFFNARDELTEGARTNVFVNLAGRWYTPPLESGVLPGVMRGVLLGDPRGAIAERVLTRADLLGADEVVVCNALRGPLRARIVHAPSQAPQNTCSGPGKVRSLTALT